MNTLPFCGYGFYGANSTTERAAFYASWGLLDVAPQIVTALISMGIPTMPYIATIPTLIR